MKCLKEKVQKVLNWFNKVLNGFSKKSPVVMTIVAIIMCVSLFQNHEAQKLTRKLLELQEKEFKLRNRPLITTKNYNFVRKEGQRKLEMYIENISEVPANQVKGFHQVFLNGKLVGRFPINQVSPAAIAKGGPSKNYVPLTEDTYSDAMDEKNKFKVVTELTYSGMLGEEADAYKTSMTIYYYVPEKDFRYEDAKYE